MDVELLILIAGIIGTIAFAVSGALIAIENKLDLFGVLILGCVTACGGGLIRDVMLRREITLFNSPWYPIIACSVSLLVFIAMYFLKSEKWENSKIYKVFYNITDSIGLGAFVITGADIAILSGNTNIFPVVFYAVLTACGGGMIRDILVMKIPAIFRKHIYAVAAIIGALYFYLLYYFNVPHPVIAITTVILVVIIRYLAFRFEWSLPKVKLSEDNIE